MLEFAVTVKGEDENQAYWVLAVQANRLLMADINGVLLWRSMNDCRFAKMIRPDAPRPVISVAPQDQLVRASGLQRSGNGY